MSSTRKRFRCDEYVRKFRKYINNSSPRLANDFVELGEGPHAVDAINRTIRRLEELKQKLTKQRNTIIDRAFDDNEKIVPLRKKVH